MAQLGGYGRMWNSSTGRHPTIGPLGRTALALTALLGLTAPGGSAVAQEVLAPGETVRIALLPIVVHSAEDPRYLREGLADMLSARLDQASVFSVKRVEDPEAATTRVAEALERARSEGVEFVLFGSFTRFGQGASLDIQCVAVSPDDEREPLREIFVHSGSIGDVIPDLDELVGKIARFTVQDFESRAAVSSGPAGAPEGNGQVADLPPPPGPHRAPARRPHARRPAPGPGPLTALPRGGSTLRRAAAGASRAARAGATLRPPKSSPPSSTRFLRRRAADPRAPTRPVAV